MIICKPGAVPAFLPKNQNFSGELLGTEDRRLAARPKGLLHLVGVNVTHTCFDLAPRLSPFPKCV